MSSGETGIIYKITSPCGKSYIGMTTRSLKWRLARHTEHALRGVAGLLQDAIRKYGLDAMVAEVIEEVSRSELSAAEIRAIAQFNTIHPHGLNMSVGGNGGARLIPTSEIARVAKMKATMATDEYKARQRAKLKAAWSSPEKRSERAAAIKAMWADPAYREMQRQARKKPIQASFNFRLTEEDRKASYMANFSRPEARAAVAAANRARAKDPEVRARTSIGQRKAMACPKLRVQIALAMSRYKGHAFRKLVPSLVARKSSIMTRTWPTLPDVFTTEDLYAAGWGTREIDRAIYRDWMAVHSVQEGVNAPGYSACDPNNKIYGKAA